MSAGRTASSAPPFLQVIAAGARTSLGFGLASSAAAARAGLTAFADHPYMIDRHGLPMAVASDAWLAPELARLQRLVCLATCAASDAFDQLPRGTTMRSLRIFLALPEATEASAAAEPEAIGAAVRQALSGRADAVVLQACHLGHVAGIAAARAAANAVLDGFDGHCLLVGVDTWLDAATLEWLDHKGLLATRRRPFGFVPGEAGAALLLAPGTMQAAAGFGTQLQCSGLALEGPDLLASDQPHLGRALTTAARAALGGIGKGGVQAVYADLNGVPERADEVGYTVVRLRDKLAQEFRSIAPAEWFGDVGAATVPLMVGLALQAANKGYGTGGAALILAQSIGVERAALLLSLPEVIP